MNNLPLKYLGYSVVFQEVPDEVSLAINISGCPHKCPDCHSKYLWEYEGAYILDDIDLLLDKYDGFVSCVCFMGGDQNMECLKELLIKIKQRGILTAVYSGTSKGVSIFEEVKDNLDYLKVGPYISSCGGLDSKTTNQRMYKKNGVTNEWEDITHLFWKSHKILP